MLTTPSQSDMQHKRKSSGQRAMSPSYMNFNQAAEHTGASSGLRLEAPRGKKDRTREGSKESRNFDTAPL